jgi:hypothetical protein
MPGGIVAAISAIKLSAIGPGPLGISETNPIADAPCSIAIHASAQAVPSGKRKKDKSQPKEEPKEKEPARLDLTGGFANSEEAALLAVALNSGPLPYPLIVRGQQPVAQ